MPQFLIAFYGDPPSLVCWTQIAPYPPVRNGEVMKTLSSRQLSLGGIRIDALEQSDLIQLLRPAEPTGGKLLIAHHNLHSLYLYETDRAFRDFYERASWVYIDGLPLVWLGRAAGLPFRTAHRITFLDSFDAILHDAVQHGRRIFYLGSSEQVIEAGLPLLRAAHPQLVICGHHGFLATAAESEAVIAQINDFQADILFVGMGMPIQEMWLAEHQEKINVRAILTSGGTLDYVTGHSYRPPEWAGRLGLYGVFRLFSDPRRLWRRYILEPILLIGYLGRRLTRARRSANEATVH